MKKSLNFWAFVLLPWLLELFFGTQFFSTLLGSILWTSILLQGLVRSQVLDQRLRKGLFRTKVATFAIWNVLWAFHFLENDDAHFGSGIPNLESKFWIQAHVALLTAGVAASIGVFTTALLARIQDRRLRSDSWQRRGQGLVLPSLESLSKATRLSAKIGLLLWAVGSVLAALTLAFKSRSESLPLQTILLDDQIVGVAAFLVLHVLTVILGPRIFGKERAMSGYLIFSALFIVSFVLWSIAKESSFHSPLRWLIP